MSRLAMAHKERKYDGCCKVVGTVLCVQKQLMEIATGANSIRRILVEIEEHIIDTENQSHLFNEHIKNVTKLVSSRLPTYHYSEQFFKKNKTTINQNELTHLLKENYNAMIIYYNSINDILNLSDSPR
ncbi:unnamed protein product, partial [Rotaria sordida]